MIAFVDESAPETPTGLCYVVAAAVLFQDDLARARTKVQKLLLPGQQRFHWTNERESRRLAMLELIADLGVMVLAEWCFPVGRRRQSQARANCLTSLLADLAREDVGQVVVEHRDEAGDRQDRQTFIEAKHAGLAAELRYEFRRPADEALLWVADAAAGAVSLHVAGRTSTYYDHLRANVLMIRRIEL